MSCRADLKKPFGPKIVSAAIILALSALGAPRASFGQATEAADAVDKDVDALVRKGLELRREGKHEEALGLFRQAHQIRPSARTFGQIGFAEQQLRRWVEAEQNLAASLSAADSPWLLQHRELVEQQLEKVRRRIGELIVIGTTGASVSVNGRAVGVLPLTRAIRVPDGVVSVAARADGYEPYSKEVVVAGGGSSSLEIVLKPVVPTPNKGASTVIDVGRTSDSAPLIGGAVREQPAGGLGWQRIGAGTLGVVGLAAIAGGAVAWSKHGQPSCGRPVCPALHDYRLLTLSLMVGGLASVVGGAWWFFAEPQVGLAGGSSLALGVRGTL